MTDPQVLVLGSLNLDVIIDLQRIPAPGETVLTDAVDHGAGGKGGNQAVAAARSGARTAMIGAVGTDDGAALLLDSLGGAGVDDASVRRLDGPSGTAYVMVDRSGENAIVVVGGANAQLTELTDADRSLLRRTPILLMQLETPMSTVTEAARIAHETGGRVLLNAAPYADLPEELLDAVDLLIVNEHEAALTARAILAGDPPDDPADLAAALLTRVPAVLLTLGGDGSVLARRDADPIHTPARSVQVVDTTGAGDTFVGAYAAASADPAYDEAAALRFATAAAALAVQTSGAVASIPSRDRIENLLQTSPGA